MEFRRVLFRSLGGRLGYILFYALTNYLADPLNVFKIWQGGMSFHGGLLGVLIAMWLFGKKTNRTFFQVTDFIAPMVPIGLGAGRIGNFINGELWGRASDVPWAIVTKAGMPARHPSQLYEAFLEGLMLFLILWFYSKPSKGIPKPTMAVSAMFLIFYGLFRFIVEFVRTPDAHIGYLAFDWLTMGMVLSAPMVILGIVLLWLAYNKESNNK